MEGEEKESVRKKIKWCKNRSSINKTCAIVDEQFNGTLTGMEKQMENVGLETFYPCLNAVFLSFIVCWSSTQLNNYFH